MFVTAPIALDLESRDAADFTVFRWLPSADEVEPAEPIASPDTWPLAWSGDGVIWL
jgi:hypothetical protein